jgi:alkylation response protein AidB-like acyl-CoA dehydrogenase
MGADPEHQLIIGQELTWAGIDAQAHNPIGIGWAGPTILQAGTDAQRERYLGPLLGGQEFWCQLFSEPASGSDLASLTTRAERDGDTYIVNGQKVWTTWADQADFGILLARTDPSASRHRGISYFICPMRQPGVEVRPIREMTGRAHFNEVFLTDVRVPAGNLVGQPNQGWSLAKVTLGNERVSLSTGGVLWGMGPTTGEVIQRLIPVVDAVSRDRVAALHVEAEVLRLLGLRIVSDLIRDEGRAPAAEVAVKKLLADRHGQKLMDLAQDHQGPGGMIDQKDEATWGFLFSPALTIGGGTSEVLRNVIGEQLLGLPREVAS